MMTGADLTSKSAEVIGQFLQEGEAVRSLTSPAGKYLALQFRFRDGALAAAISYSIPERRRIVKQLRLGLEEFYVHLDRKKSMYGFDPVRALDLLAPSVEIISDGDFHQSITQLIARTRDRHLVFFGRPSFGLSATLPFMIERCWMGEDALYVVTKIASGFTPQQLRVGAMVTHWNGIPIERFVRLNANVFDGGNEAASLARSLAFLTQRPLSRFGPPLEEWVYLRFRLQGITHEEKFTWEGFNTTGAPPTPSVGRNLTGFGGDLELLNLQHTRRVQFAPQSFDAPPQDTNAATAPAVPQIIARDPSGNFDYGCVTTEHGTFGYIRLWSFRADSSDDIINAFIPALRQLPRKGLIIDMRGNSGGYIAAGERVLQLFTPQLITPTRFQFRVTPVTQAMVSATSEFQTWRQSFGEALATGEPYSQGYPIEGSDEDANKVGQRYFGPVVLITDALAFSTADMFAAGFIDHEIGRVLCTDKNMAAAGGNNWVPWDIVRLYNPDFHLDPGLKPKFDEGVLSPEVHDAFNREGASLSDKAAISAGRPQYDGVAWRIGDGVLTHVVRHLPWMDKPLCAYLDNGHLGLADMPEGVTLSLTMRRCVRVRKNEGKLLEDLGIQPDVVYRMTVRDITEKNQDLFTRASLDLSRMPVYDLNVEAVLKGDRYILACRTLNLTSLEIFTGQRHLTAAPASDGTSCELSVPGGLDRVVVKGLRNSAVVVRTIITLPA